MYKFLIIGLLLVTFRVSAQQSVSFEQADSISYQYYINGNWDKLISYSQELIAEDVDFKNLRKRMAYAYFVQADYFAAQQQYENALRFDNSDVDAKIYLYYCGINRGDNAYAQYYAGKLSTEVKKSLGLRSFKVLDAVDLEYNYKLNGINTRSNPNYLRIGCATQLGYNVSLYQAVSNYKQSVINSKTLIGTITTTNSALKNQTEYYAALNWQIASKLALTFGYHYLNANLTDSTIIIDSRLRSNNANNTTTVTTVLPGNMFVGKLSTRFNRIDLNLYGSIFTMNSTTTNQLGIEVGYCLPGAANLYLQSSLYSMIEASNNRLVFSQSAGLTLFKKCWLEGNVTLGNLNNYAQNNGLYVYNSDDETTFRVGGTLIWYCGKKISLLINYGYDKKLITTNSLTYNQHSFTGGLIWKI